MKLVASVSQHANINLKALFSETRISVSSSRMDWELSIRLAIKLGKELSIRLAINSGIKEIIYFFQEKLSLSSENRFY